jgi:hypothetical protein
MRKRYVQIDGELHEVSDGYTPEPICPLVQPDIQPYQSMVDGSWITSRSQHREHVRSHGLIEYGNEKITAKPASLPKQYYEQRKATVTAMVNHYGEDRIRRDAKALGEHLRWNSRGK